MIRRHSIGVLETYGVRDSHLLEASPDLLDLLVKLLKPVLSLQDKGLVLTGILAELPLYLFDELVQLLSQISPQISNLILTCLDVLLNFSYHNVLHSDDYL
jgi:hypothetical protein